MALGAGPEPKWAEQQMWPLHNRLHSKHPGKQQTSSQFSDIIPGKQKHLRREQSTDGEGAWPEESPKGQTASLAVPAFCGESALQSKYKIPRLLGEQRVKTHGIPGNS